MASTPPVRGAPTAIRQVAFPLAMKNSGMSNQARTIERKANKQCVHYWIIDRDNVGRCIKCGAVKDFGKLLGKWAEGHPDRWWGYPNFD
jgi:hypothetical protein